MIASPFILIGIIIISDINDVKSFKLMETIVGGFCIPPIIYYFYHSSYNSKEKTGRSFKTKRGIEIDEYKTVHHQGIKMDIEQQTIMLLYFIIGIVVFLVDYYLF